MTAQRLRFTDLKTGPCKATNCPYPRSPTNCVNTRRPKRRKVASMRRSRRQQRGHDERAKADRQMQEKQQRAPSWWCRAEANSRIWTTGASKADRIEMGGEENCSKWSAHAFCRQCPFPFRRCQLLCGGRLLRQGRCGSLRAVARRSCRAARADGQSRDEGFRRVAARRTAGRDHGRQSRPVTPARIRDLTFSVPKSWSLLALVGKDERIVAAYREAVIEALQWAKRTLPKPVSSKGRGSDRRNGQSRGRPLPARRQPQPGAQSPFPRGHCQCHPGQGWQVADPRE